MAGRRDVKVGSGASGVNVRGYWLLRANGDWANAMTASADGKVSLTSFDIAADAASQHWVILTAEETQAFDSAARGSVLAELTALIGNLRAMMQTAHTEDVADADAVLEAALAEAEAVVANAEATLDVLQAACKVLRQAGMDFLGSVTPVSVDEPFDLTFLMADPAITTGEGWSVLKSVVSSCIEFYEQAFDFNQTIEVPAGTYDLRAQAFNRPGEAAAVYADYHKGKNNVVAYLYAGSASTKICHLAEGASPTKLHSDDKAMTSPQGYVPNTMASSATHFAKGYYDNSLVFNLSAPTNLKVGLRQTTSASYYWTIFDNFRLYYYGSMSVDKVTSVDCIDTDDVSSRSAVYNIYGQKIADSPSGLPRGLYIYNGKKVFVQ